MKFKRSCLRWPGNKYSLLSQILPIAQKINFNNYHEPFVGSASVFLNVSTPHLSYLSDTNTNLINFYTQVQKEPTLLIEKIKRKINTEEFFYQERLSEYSDKIEQAAQFYYLNRTCFNGIYRVNSKGKFNVPYGSRQNLVISDDANLRYLNVRLNQNNVKLSHGDFTNCLQYTQKGDLVYFDPPYSAMTNDKSFLMYNETLFSWHDQVRLEILCAKLIEKGVHIIMNNLYNEEVFNIFGKILKLNTIVTERHSVVGAQQNSRGVIKEYLFTTIEL